VQNKLVKILVFFLLITVSSETVVSLWANSGISVVINENEENNNSKDSEEKKGESTEKYFQELLLQQPATNNKSWLILNHIQFKYSAYLSLPEIPPEQV
jgi:hypothetical protein